MQANEIIKEVLKERNITQGDLTEMLGMKYQSGVSQALNRDMKMSMLSRFAEVMNCEVILRDKKSNKEWVVGEKPISVKAQPSTVDLETLLADDETTKKKIKLK